MPNGFSVLTLPPGVDLATHAVSPPIEAYVTPDAQLHVALWSSVAVTVVLSYRVLQPNGKVTVAQSRYTGTGTRSGIPFITYLTEGFLLGITATVAPAQTSRRGQTYIAVLLATGDPASPVYGLTTFAGYLSNLTVLSWPPGSYESSFSGNGWVHTIVGTTPALGAEIAETVPTGAIWQLLSFRYTLTASAAVANRTSALVVTDGTNTLQTYLPAAAETASQVTGYTWVPNAAAAAPVVGNTIAGISPVVFLNPGATLNTYTANLQSGDQYSAPVYQIMEWLQS